MEVNPTMQMNVTNGIKKVDVFDAASSVTGLKIAIAMLEINAIVAESSVTG